MLTLRETKGTPLTHAEMDNNFTHLRNSLIDGNMSKFDFTIKKDDFASWSSINVVLPLISYDFSLDDSLRINFRFLSRFFSEWKGSDGVLNLLSSIDTLYYKTIYASSGQFDFNTDTAVTTLSQSVSMLGFGEIILLTNPTSKKLFVCYRAFDNESSNHTLFMETDRPLSLPNIQNVPLEVYTTKLFVSEASLTA